MVVGGGTTSDGAEVVEPLEECAGAWGTDNDPACARRMSAGASRMAVTKTTIDTRTTRFPSGGSGFTAVSSSQSAAARPCLATSPPSLAPVRMVGQFDHALNVPTGHPSRTDRCEAGPETACGARTGIDVVVHMMPCSAR